MTTPTAPKYRTTTQACSCPGFWYRRRCRHIIAYREAVALVQAQDAVNLAWVSRAARRCTTAAEELCTTGTMRKD